MPGRTSPDGSTWNAGDPLEFDTSYRYGFTIVDLAGRETEKVLRFSTVATANEAAAAVFPLNGSTIVAGRPIEIKTATVTLGDADWLSPTGYAVFMEQERESRFNAGSIGLKPGDKGYYPPLTAEYANRLTTSGVCHQVLESAWGAEGFGDWNIQWPSTPNAEPVQNCPESDRSRGGTSPVLRP